MNNTEPLIVQVIHRYHPDWVPPRDTGRTWLPCHCPFHGDESPSAAVSFVLDAYKCHACPVHGDVIKILRSQEGMSYSEALEFTTELPLGSNREVPIVAPRKPSRGVLTDPGSSSVGRSARDQPIRPGLRGRPFGRA